MKRRHFIKTLGASVALLKTRRAWPQTPPQRLVLAEGGQSAYSIYLSPDASPSEEHGAMELQRFLQEASGARLPLITSGGKLTDNLVLVGQSDAVDDLGFNIPFRSLGGEGYALKTHGHHLVIAGGRQRGTMYGVYGFLEKLGCRWFTPEVSRIPKLPSVSIAALDEIGRPSFEYRYPYFSECMDRDWAARNRMNGTPSLDAVTGGSVQYYPFVHTFYTLIPPKKYFKDHPEYFALVDGKRRGERAQLCLTNPEVLKITIATVLGWIQDHPEATLYSVSQNDYAGWCECSNCRRVEREEGGAHSGPILRFVNSVAAAVAKRHPDKLIDTLAYAYSQAPPTRTRPRPNVRIRLCPIGACQAHPYETCRFDAYIMKDLRGWAKLTGPQLYIWHYVTNFSYSLRPFPDFDELSADIPMYHRNGVVGIFAEGFVSEGGGAAGASLKSYLIARLLWDQRASPRRAIDEFHRAYYGEAARPMQAYLDSLEGLVRFPPAGQGQHVWCCSSPHFSGEFLNKANRLLNQAESTARNSSTRRRVENARLSLDYLELVQAKQFSVHGDEYRPVNLTALKDQHKAFINRIRSFGITTLSEGGSLERDEQTFGEIIKPYRVVSLENEWLLVRLVPELSARIIQIIDKRTGTDALLGSDPNSVHYPDTNGIATLLYPDSHAPKPWKIQWSLESRSGKGSAVLSGTTANGLRLREEIELLQSKPWIHTQTTIKNAGTAAITFALGSQMEANPGGETPDAMDSVWVNFSRVDGAKAKLKLIKPDEEPAGGETYSGASQPNGEWRIANRRTGLVVTSRFAQNKVERCELSWSTKNWSAANQNRVGFMVWTHEQPLAPGQDFSFEAEYGVEFQHARPGERHISPRRSRPE